MADDTQRPLPAASPAFPAPDVQVEVTMGSRRYRLRGTDPAHLEALAAKVDGTLTSIAGPGGDRDEYKVAVLAALNIASDADDQRAAWHAEAQRIARDGRDVEGRLQRLLDAL